MVYEAKIHEAQVGVLRELLFVKSARFSALRKKVNLESDHFKFHIARLIESGYVEKMSSGEYTLTQQGKEYANKLDTDANKLERQPKSAVIIVLKKQDTVLLQERLKHPYFGFWGYPGGKIRWGETIYQAAARELLEETGLTARLTYQGVYHELTRSEETNVILEDKIFQVFSATHPSGKIKTSFDGGRNEWIALSAIQSITKKYKSTDIETDIGLGKLSFIEKEQVYSAEEF